MVFDHARLRLIESSKKIQRILSLFLDEIFQRHALLFWSPNNQHLAFVKINLKSLPENHYLNYDLSVNNKDQYSIPYPKHGDPLPLLDVYIYNIKSGKTTRVPRPAEYENLYDPFRSEEDQEDCTMPIVFLENPIVTSFTLSGIAIDVYRSCSVIVARIRVLFNFTRLKQRIMRMIELF